MIRIELSLLVDRLNPLSRHQLEAAAASCVQSQGAEIRVEQWLLQMLETPLCDVRLILQQAEVDVAALKALLEPCLIEKGPAAGYPSFSPLLVEWLQDSWLLASTEFQHAQLRSGVMLLVLLMTPQRYLPQAAVALLARVNRDLLRQQFSEWVKGSAESQLGSQGVTGAQGAEPHCATLLSRFCTNITEQARSGGLDPVLCREPEIELMMDILCRRRKNNPLVVGEAGVGKSALIEGLALRIVAGQVPESLRQVELLSLDLGALQAGASIKGEFEKRFQGVMQEVKAAPYPVILFIDEAHTLIGTGNQQGGLDLSNLLKPALARGELRTIAATTWREYKQYVEKDAALSRRFELVKVGEPSAHEATTILRGLRPLYEQAHGVLIADEALQAAAHLSARYLSGRQLPDKAIDLLDTAAARVALNQSAPPRVISQLQDRIGQRALEIGQLERQSLIGLGEHAERLALLHREQEDAMQRISQLESQWQAQLTLVQPIITLRGQLLAAESGGWAMDPELAANRERLAHLERQLAELQQQESLVCAHVDRAQIAAVIADWTGVPLNRITQGELEVVTNLPEHLGDKIKGQALAIDQLHRHLLTARADLRRPGRPLGAFLLVGPSGVGKTETVLQLAELLFGGTHYLTTINMSEYQEKHTVSRLIGSPPGYVGFGEGGILTEAIRRKPYSLVLLDEVEKAHPDVLNLFYQAFDKGELADGEGRLIDCKNVLFCLTSNLGTQTIVELAEQPERLREALYPELATFFKPALLARMEVIPYLPLGPEVLVEIVEAKLNGLKALLKQRFGVESELDERVAQEILQRAQRSEHGARILESVIDGAVLPQLSLQLLQQMASGARLGSIYLGVDQGQFVARVTGL